MLNYVIMVILTYTMDAVSINNGYTYIQNGCSIKQKWLYLHTQWMQYQSIMVILTYTMDAVSINIGYSYIHNGCSINQ